MISALNPCRRLPAITMMALLAAGSALADDAATGTLRFESTVVAAHIRRATGMQVFGSHVCWRDEHAWWIDGIAGTNYGGVEQVTFSPDGGHYAYLATSSRNHQPLLVIDGREIVLKEAAPGSTALRFSDDATRVQFVEQHENEAWLVVNGIRSRHWTGELFCGPFLDDDGAHYRIMMRHGNEVALICDDAEVARYPLEAIQNRLQMPSGSTAKNHIVFARALDVDRFQLICDGIPLKPHRNITSVQFSTDGQHLAFTFIGPNGPAMSLDGEEIDNAHAVMGPHGAMILDEDHNLFFNGHKIPLDSDIIGGNVAFSADGKHFAAPVAGDRQLIVRDTGNERVPPPDDGFMDLMLSADGAHLAYITGPYGNTRFVIDGKPQAEFERLFSMRDDGSMPNIFSPDGKHYAYLGVRPGNAMYLVIDGVKAPLLEWPMRGPLVFAADGSVDVFAVRDDARTLEQKVTRYTFHPPSR